MSNPQITIGVQAVDQAAGVLQKVDSEVDRTANNVITSGDKMQSKTSTVVNNIKENWSSMAMSAASLGAGIVSFATSFDTLEKAQVRADQANLTLAKSQARLAELQSSGKASAEEIQRAQEAVSIATDKARLAQDAQSDTYTNFLAQVPLQLLSFGTSAITMYSMLTAGEAEATGGMNLFKIASIQAFITNPVGIAIIGITTLVSLLVFNVGGLRDVFYSVGAAIVDFLKKFTPLGILIDTFVNNVLKPMGIGLGEDTPKNVDKSEQALDSFSTTAIQTSAQITDFGNTSSASFEGVGTTATATAATMQADFTEAAENVTKAVDKMIDSVDKLIAKLKSLIQKQKEAGVNTTGTAGSSSSVSYKGLTGAAAVAAKAAGFAQGGTINEPIFGVGQSGQFYTFGERGPETIVPAGKGDSNKDMFVTINMKGTDIESIEAQLGRRKLRTAKVKKQILRGAG